MIENARRVRKAGFRLVLLCLAMIFTLGFAACQPDSGPDPGPGPGPDPNRPPPGPSESLDGVDCPEATDPYVDVPEEFTGLNIRQTGTQLDVIWEETPGASSYDIYRAGSRLGERTKVATVSKKGEVAGYNGWGYTDAKPNADKYENYYFIIAKSSSGAEIKLTRPPLAQHEKAEAKPFIDCQWISLEKKIFGENTYFYDAAYDNIQAIGAEMNQIGGALQGAGDDSQMSYNRVAIYFKPGEYKGYTTTDGRFNTKGGGPSLWVGFNTSVSGLGITPDLTKIGNRIVAPAALDGNGEGGNVTHNFWRSVENFEMSDGAEFCWSVSQAAPARRIYVNGGRTRYENGGWASGGFVADCYFKGEVNGGGQQQFYHRNSHFEGDFKGINWNQMTQGSTSKDPQNPPRPSNYMNGRQDIWLDETPLIRERPFLYLDQADGEYKVFVPGLRKNSKGVSWMDEDGKIIPGVGISRPLSDFYVAKTGDSAKKLNAKLASGKHLFLTPGWYEAEEPIHVTIPDTIILGTGMATINPGKDNGYGALLLDDVSGINVAHVMLDAHYSSTYLIRVGGMAIAGPGKGADHSQNPTQFSDVFCRVGGWGGNVRADVSMQINSNNVIGDHCWLWVADHGRTRNPPAAHGLIVSGDDVTLYGTFVEHYQKYQTIWFGNGGRSYFYQNESPYGGFNGDMHDGNGEGWCAYKVWNTVETHHAFGMGIYGVSTGDKLTNAIEAPQKPGVKLEALFTKSLNGGGHALNVINGTGGSTQGAPNGNERRVALFENGMATVGNADPVAGVAPEDEKLDIPSGPIKSAAQE